MEFCAVTFHFHVQGRVREVLGLSVSFIIEVKGESPDEQHKTWLLFRSIPLMTSKISAHRAYSNQGPNNRIQLVSGEHTKLVLFTTQLELHKSPKMHCCMICHVEQRIVSYFY